MLSLDYDSISFFRFSYVSTLLIVDKLGGGKGILLSIVLVMRFLPSVFMFPIAGIFADR